jgi:hypothetical protein
VSANFRWGCGQLLNLNPIDRLGHLAAVLDTSSMNPQTTEESLSLVMGGQSTSATCRNFDRGNGFGRRDSFSNFFGFNHLRRSCPGPASGHRNASILQLTRVPHA